jgi:hypothetical protein
MDFALPRRTKFGIRDDAKTPYAYPGVYQLEATSDGGERLVIGPADAHIDLLAKLAECLPEPLRILYVLVVPRSEDAAAARYEAPDELSRQDLCLFLREFSEFLEFDGRHHLWVVNPDHGTIVYDRHNILYAYGPLDCFTGTLDAQGLRRGQVDVPGPHWHRYHREYDEMQRRLLGRWAWSEKPLRPSDET